MAYIDAEVVYYFLIKLTPLNKRRVDNLSMKLHVNCLYSEFNKVETSKHNLPDFCTGSSIYIGPKGKVVLTKCVAGIGKLFLAK